MCPHGAWHSEGRDQPLVLVKDDLLEASANLPAPEIIAAEIADDLEAALEQFATIPEDLKA